MSNVTSIIKLGAAVLITVAAIAIAVALFGQGQEITRGAEGDLKGLNQVMTSNKYAAYNNTDVSGSMVINSIRMYGEQGTVTVNVKTTAGASVAYTPGQKYSITNIADNNYINPTGTFGAQLTTNANGIITAITFTQK